MARCVNRSVTGEWLVVREKNSKPPAMAIPAAASRVRVVIGNAFHLYKRGRRENHLIRLAIVKRRGSLPLFTFVRFEPRPGQETRLRDELKLVLEPTRAEPGCLRINLYESTRDPLVFYIHSEWKDEAAFDAHAGLPHMTRFLGLVGDLITHRVQGVRTRRIA